MRTATSYLQRGAITLTRHTAYCSGVDAANRQMRAAGRAAWSEADRDLAVDTQLRLMRAGGLLDDEDRPTPLYFEAQALDAPRAY